MTTPRSMPALPQSSGKRPTPWGLGIVVLSVLVATAFVASRRSPQPPPPPQAATRDLAELLRVDGRLVLRSDTNQSFTGWMTEQYPDGTLKSRSEISNGILNGISEGFHTNGTLQVREAFASGIGNGPVQKWYPDGSALSEGTAHAGRLEGVFRRWHPNGRLAEEIHLRNGQPHGLSRAWFPSGCLKAEAELNDGTLVRQAHWNDGEREPEPTVAAALRP